MMLSIINALLISHMIEMDFARMKDINLPNGFLHPSKKNEIQYLDERCNAVFPWYAKPFLDELAKMDTKKWSVFEYGSGFSTLWFALNCQTVISVENDAFWSNAVREYIVSANITNTTVLHHNGPNDSIFFGGYDDPYIKSIEEYKMEFDCIIIDGIYRNETALNAVNYVKDGGILIYDNFDQKSIGGSCQEVEEFLSCYEHHSYLHPASMHPNNINDWRTDYWIIKK